MDGRRPPHRGAGGPPTVGHRAYPNTIRRRPAASRGRRASPRLRTGWMPCGERLAGAAMRSKPSLTVAGRAVGDGCRGATHAKHPPRPRRRPLQRTPASARRRPPLPRASRPRTRSRCAARCPRVKDAAAPAPDAGHSRARRARAGAPRSALRRSFRAGPLEGVWRNRRERRCAGTALSASMPASTGSWRGAATGRARCAAKARHAGPWAPSMGARFLAGASARRLGKRSTSPAPARSARPWFAGGVSEAPPRLLGSLGPRRQAQDPRGHVGPVALNPRRPRRLRRPTPGHVVDRIVSLRCHRLAGARVATATGVSTATVSRVLKRTDLSRIKDPEPEEPARRCQHDHPGGMTRTGAKKPVRFERSGCHVAGTRAGHRQWAGRVRARPCGRRLARRLRRPSPTRSGRAPEGARGLLRAPRGRRPPGVTGNGPCHASRAFAAAREELGVRHIRTKAYTSKTNAAAELHPDGHAGVGLRPALRDVGPARRQLSGVDAHARLADRTPL